MQEVIMCTTCVFNSDLDFYESGWTDDGKRLEICVHQKQNYPYARSCASYEPVGKVDGDGID